MTSDMALRDQLFDAIEAVLTVKADADDATEAVIAVLAANDWGDVCGHASMHGGFCDLPRGHNRGRLDVPENHHFVTEPETTTTTDTASCDHGDVTAERIIPNPQPPTYP